MVTYDFFIFCSLRTSLWGLGFPVGLDGEEYACSSRDLGSIPGSGISLGEGNGKILQYSCLGNPIDREAWGLQSMGLQSVGHDVVTKQQQQNGGKVQNNSNVLISILPFIYQM